MVGGDHAGKKKKGTNERRREKGPLLIFQGGKKTGAVK